MTHLLAFLSLCSICLTYRMPFLCNGCYDMSLKALSMQSLTIINHNGNNYCVNFAFISKKDACNLTKNATIIDKKGTL